MGKAVLPDSKKDDILDTDSMPSPAFSHASVKVPVEVRSDQ